MSDLAEVRPTEWVLLAKAEAIPEGTMKGFTVQGKPILLTRLGGKFYAMDAVCSHLYGYLPRGAVDGVCVECPVHRARYDVRTGKVVKNIGRMLKLATHREATDLQTYEVRVVAGSDLLVQVPSQHRRASQLPVSE